MNFLLFVFSVAGRDSIRECIKEQQLCFGRSYPQVDAPRILSPSETLQLEKPIPRRYWQFRPQYRHAAVRFIRLMAAASWEMWQLASACLRWPIRVRADECSFGRVQCSAHRASLLWWLEVLCCAVMNWFADRNLAWNLWPNCQILSNRRSVCHYRARLSNYASLCCLL